MKVVKYYCDCCEAETNVSELIMVNIEEKDFTDNLQLCRSCWFDKIREIIYDKFKGTYTKYGTNFVL